MVQKHDVTIANRQHSDIRIVFWSSNVYYKKRNLFGLVQSSLYNSLGFDVDI